MRLSSVALLGPVAALLGGCSSFDADDKNIDAGGDSDAAQAYSIAVRFVGVGHGVVEISGHAAPTTGTLCEQDCILPMPDADDVYVRAGTTQRITTSSCGLESSPSRECALSTSSTHAVFITIEPDGNEVTTLLRSEGSRAVAFTSAGDLVLGHGTSIDRVGLDGATRWSVARTNETELLAISASGLILAGPSVAAYHEDGSTAWTSNLVAKSLAFSPDGNPVIATASGTVAALSATTGAVLWEKPALGATAVAVNAVGEVFAARGDEVLRFRANGVSRPSWTSPYILEHIAFDASGRLVGSSGPHSVPSTFVYFYVRFDSQGVSSVLAQTREETPLGFALTAGRLFKWCEWRSETAYHNAPLMHLSALDDAGTQTWLLSKGYNHATSFGPGLYHPGDIIAPLAGACDPNRRCVVTGFYSGPPTPSRGGWVGVYDLP